MGPKRIVKKETQSKGNPVDINGQGVLRYSRPSIQEPARFIFPIRFFRIFLISSFRCLLDFIFRFFECGISKMNSNRPKTDAKVTLDDLKVTKK